MSYLPLQVTHPIADGLISLDHRNDSARKPAAMVPTSSLLPSHSPRIAGEDERHVEALAESDAPLPPIVVHRSTMRVVDGMHRLRAAALRSQERIAVQFFEGNEEDAFVLAVELNSAHGLPLSRADRACAAARIIASHPQWSDRRIAAVTGLAASSVAAMRPRSTEKSEQLTKRVGRDGRSRPLNPAEGRIRASRLLAAKPGSTLKEVAEESGVSLATAKDVRDRVRAGKDPLPPRLRSAARTQPGPTGIDERPADPSHALLHTSPPDLDFVLRQIAKDPSMRTDAGRCLAQLLRTHALVDESKWCRLAAGVPGHRAAAVAQAARVCAEQWLRLAREVEASSHEALG